MHRNGGAAPEPNPSRPCSLDYAFYRIQEVYKLTLIYLEEAWFLLDNEKFAKGIDNWLQATLAKKNAWLVMATQSLVEVARSKIFATIIDNIPNPDLPAQSAGHGPRRHVATPFMLNDEQINRIRNAIPKRNYYIVTPRLSRMVDVHLPPEIMAVVRSDERAQQVFKKHEASNDEFWRDNYLKEILNHA